MEASAVCGGSKVQPVVVSRVHHLHGDLTDRAVRAGCPASEHLESSILGEPVFVYQQTSGLGDGLSRIDRLTGPIEDRCCAGRARSEDACCEGELFFESQGHQGGSSGSIDQPMRGGKLFEPPISGKRGFGVPRGWQDPTPALGELASDSDPVRMATQDQLPV